MSKIYVIDESEHYVEMVKIRLMNYGYSDIKSFIDVGRALEAIKLDAPDLVLIDTRLGGADGYSVCRRIKEFYGQEIKVILMAGLSEVYDVTKALEANADDYVVKTFDCALLMTAIKKMLFQLQALKENI